MRFILHFIISFIGNAIALVLAAHFIGGFSLMPDLVSIASVAVLLTIANVVIRPILRIILTPVIIITLGLFNLVLNAGLLYAVDILSSSLTISGLPTLAYATILITVVNLAVHIFIPRHS